MNNWTNFYKDLKTERFILNRMKLSDAPEIFHFRSDPEILTYLAREPLSDISQAEEWIQNGIDSIINKTGITWAIRETEDSPMIGNVGIWRFMGENYRGEVGYTLHPKYQGKGIMTECFRTVVEYGFEELNLHSYQAEIDPNNTASKNLLERLNFKKEAHFTEDYYFDGKFTDSAIYSLVERWYRK